MYASDPSVTRLVVGSRVVMCGASDEVVDDITSEFEFTHKGYGETTHRVTWSRCGDAVSLPRGALARVMQILSKRGVTPAVMDLTTLGTAAAFPSRSELWDYQSDAHDLVVKSRGGCIRMPTGSGKTRTALTCAASLGRRTLVLCPNDVRLAGQWVEEIGEVLGVPSEDVGRFFDGSRRHGDRITVAIPAGITVDEARAGNYGTVMLDEAQFGAAATYYQIVDALPARYRLAWSAWEKRTDHFHQLTYDLFGPVIVDVDRAQLERRGYVAPVTVRLVETEFGKPTGFGRTRLPPVHILRRQMADDRDRNRLIADVVSEVVRDGLVPVVVFSHLRDHVETLAETLGVGMMRGGAADRRASDAVQSDLVNGNADVAVATYSRFGVGHDVKRLTALVCGTPMGGDAVAYFNQVRGRAARRGKDRGYLYYLWDRHIYSHMGKMIGMWNADDVQIRDRGRWRGATPTDLGARGHNSGHV